MTLGCREVKEVIETVKSLEDLISSTFSAASDLWNTEIGRCWDDIKKGFTDLPDLWDVLTGDDRADFAADIAANPVFDLASQLQAQAQLESVVPTLFGGAPLVSQVDPNLAIQLENKVQGVFNNAFTGCQTNTSIYGAFQSVAQTATSTLTSAGTAIQSTIFALTNVNNDFSSAVFFEAAGNFIKRQTSEKFILKQIQDTIDEINDDLVKLTDDDYSVDHKLVINQSVIELKRADEILRAQVDNVNLKFPANRAGIEEARERIDAVRDVLSGIDLKDLFGGLLSLRVLKITARLAYLGSLQASLNAQELVSERIKVNLSGFDTLYADLTNFDELLLPSLSMARCRLGTIMAQMALSVDANKFTTYVTAEKKWALDLSVTSAILKTAQKLGKVTGDDPLNVEGISEDLGDMLGTFKADGPLIVPGQISDALDQYIQNVRYKISYNVDPTQVVARGELVNRLVDQKLAQNESFIVGLGGPMDRISQGGALAAGIAAVSMIKSAISAIANYAGGFQAMAEGALGPFLDGSFFLDILSGLLAQVIAAIEAQLAAIGCTLEDIGLNGLEAYDAFEDFVRQDALYNEALRGFPETRIRAILSDELSKFELPTVPAVAADAPALTDIPGDFLRLPGTATNLG